MRAGVLLARSKHAWQLPERPAAPLCPSQPHCRRPGQLGRRRRLGEGPEGGGQRGSRHTAGRGGAGRGGGGGGGWTDQRAWCARTEKNPRPRTRCGPRIRTLVENGVKLRQRSLFVIVGDKGRDQVGGPAGSPALEWRLPRLNGAWLVAGVRVQTPRGPGRRGRR